MLEPDVRPGSHPGDKRRIGGKLHEWVPDAVAMFDVVSVKLWHDQPQSETVATKLERRDAAMLAAVLFLQTDCYEIHLKPHKDGHWVEVPE